MNRKPSKISHKALARKAPGSSWWALPVACLATVLALPVNAGVLIPEDPLTTGARLPPNIMFILDNSGSMASVSMPACNVDPEYSGTSVGCSGTLSDTADERSYLNNTIYYNPNITYRPWMTADGVNRLTGGTSVTSVFKDWNLASNGRGTRDLRDSAESIFYVPKVGVTASTNESDFVRYWVRNNGGSAQVVRQAIPPVVLQTWSWTQTVDQRVFAYQTISVPSGTTSLQISIAGNTNSRGNADLYVRRAGDPTTSAYDFLDTGSGSSESVTIANPQSGTWYVGVYNSDSGSGDRRVIGNVLTINAFSNIEAATPTGRSQEDELKNIATWYSYFRTRLKTAKAGASEAFAGIGRLNRVGFTPINGRSSDLSATGTNAIIPVNTNDGLFETTNKTGWFSSVQGEVVKDGSTPLRTTLDAVGQYYTRTDANGPWGPGSGNDQLSCRQSFSILTTDGFWNDGTGLTFGLGDDDGDGHSVTLADVANYYYRTDLRGGTAPLKNNVPTSVKDSAIWQHMVTFSVSIGLKGTLPITSPPPASNAAIWPNPMDAEDQERIDDLWHAAVNGHGEFVAAENPETFALALKAALSAIAKRTSSYSNVATNSVSLDSGSQVFNASYVSGVWSGTVTARAISAAGVSPTISWSASVPAWASRKIFTSNGVLGTTFPTTSQQTALARTGGPVDYPVTGLENANYIRGDQSLEGPAEGELRERESLIGDIVGSAPAFVKDTNTLYVGANDGMLHAFNAANGQELFAYVPNIIDFPSLASLSHGAYTHRFFVDGPIAVSNRNLTPGENILVGTLGKGGKGMYSLNVGSPASVSATSVFNWELADTANGNMGLVLGKPVLGKVPGGQKAAIIGNGVNSTNERAVLIVVDLDTGAVLKEIDTGVGSASTPNGLSAPIGVYGQDGATIRYAYAGDMLGNVWKFDLNGAGTATKLFSANIAGVPQPISGGLAVAIHPVTKKRWVYFGTGRFLTVGDASATYTAVQSMYGFVDDGGSYTRSDLTARTVSATGTVNGFPVRAFQSKTSLPPASKGWYIDLPVTGERIVQDAQVVNSFVLTASMIPSGDACEPDGSGYINALDAFTGTSASGSYFDLDGSGDTSNDKLGAVPVGSVNLGVGMPTLPNLLRGLLIVGGTGGDVLGDPATLNVRWDRVSWREIRQD